MTDEEFANRMKETKQALESIKEKLKSLSSNENENIDDNAIKEIINNIKSNWSYLSSNEKKQFMNMFIENIKIDKKDGVTEVLDIEFY